jgi:hypothetical protein
MATVYIKPGSGTGTGTASDPYFYSQLTTAESTAGSGGTILFTDGDYSLSGNTIWDADGVTYKALNRHRANIKFTTTSHYLRVGSTSITAPVIADGFYVENTQLNLATPLQTADANKTAKFVNVRSVQTTQHSLSPILHASADTAALGEWINCEIIAKTPVSIRPFSGCNGATMTNCSVFLDMSGTTTFSARATAIFSSITNSILASNQTNSSFITQNYTSNATNSYFYQMGTTNSSGGTNNVFGGDPLFVDESSDLRLRPASPAIGAA